MTAEPLALFVLTSVLIELTPGPNMAWLAVVAASEGRRPGAAAVAGVATGLMTIGLAAALGVGAAIAASGALYQALRWSGVLWLLWLAIDGWRDAGGPPEEAPKGGDLLRYFRRGLVTNVLNPKAAMFYVAVLPAYVDETAPVMQQTISLSVVYVAVATAIHAGIVVLAGFAERLLTDRRRTILIRRMLAVALGLIAFWFAWSTRPGGD